MRDGELSHMKLAPALVLCTSFILSGCSGHTVPSAPSSSAPAASDSLDKMATVFEGRYTRDQIKSTLDQVMPLYGTAINEDGYRRCGSVLVAMTQKTGVPEMDQLNYMRRIQQVAPGGGMTFADGAALAASSLENKSH